MNSDEVEELMQFIERAPETQKKMEKAVILHHLSKLGLGNDV